MGGNEKSLLQLSGKPPIAWVADALSPQVRYLAINANGDPQRFSFLNLPVIADTIGGFVGPLAGVLAGMRWAESLSDASHVLTAAADTPFLPPTLARKLVRATNSPQDIAMAHSVGRIHPVFGLWPISLSDELERFLVVEDKRKILEFARRHTLHEVNFDDAGEDPFFNINTPGDLEHAQSMAAEMTGK